MTASHPEYTNPTPLDAVLGINCLEAAAPLLQPFVHKEAVFLTSEAITKLQLPPAVHTLPEQGAATLGYQVVPPARKNEGNVIADVWIWTQSATEKKPQRTFYGIIRENGVVEVHTPQILYQFVSPTFFFPTIIGVMAE